MQSEKVALTRFVRKKKQNTRKEGKRRVRAIVVTCAYRKKRGRNWVKVGRKEKNDHPLHQKREESLRKGISPLKD